MSWHSTRVSIEWELWKSALTYPFAKPKEQISGLANQYYTSKMTGGEDVTLVVSTYGNGAMIKQKNASKVVAHYVKSN